MPQTVLIGGDVDASLNRKLNAAFRSARPRVVGIASSYVSTFGVNSALRMISDSHGSQCRLITNIRDAVTHPEALRLARAAGWQIRVSQQPGGIFHPKIIVGGRRFNRSGAVEPVSFSYVGSANLTRGGLISNTECGVMAENDDLSSEISQTFSVFWRNANAFDSRSLDKYAVKFAERNRSRDVRDLDALGINDFETLQEATPEAIRARRSPRANESAITPAAAGVAWAGLQSFTGEYRFQIEFPRAAGEVVLRMFGEEREGGLIDVLCEDGQTRRMRFKFYLHNWMFRLNVQNDTPGVSWAREHREGIAVVTRGRRGGAPIEFRIVRPGAEHDEFLKKSVALGTWGKTPTRLYGWL